jgi:hypothetical protein
MHHFDQFRPNIREVMVSHHFSRDLPGFDPNILLDAEHADHARLHKYEENVEGNHVFRAIIDHMHIVYCVDKDHNLIMLRAFRQFKEYEKFLQDRNAITQLVHRTHG